MDTEHLAKQLVLWMRAMVSATGYNGVVVGINDGINSSIAAALCHHTFPQNMFGALIPYHNSMEDSEHAQAVASKFSISTKIVTLILFLTPYSMYCPMTGEIPGGQLPD